MSVMTTATGYQVDLAKPKVSGAISAAVIAHHLAQINRFNGATCRPYSVAEHSLLVWEIAARDLELDVHGQLAALVHDGHEAFVGDVTTPMKDALRAYSLGYGYGRGSDFDRVNAGWKRAVRSAFGVSVASHVHAEAIHRADLIALATECLFLLPRDIPPWPILEGVQPAAWVDLRDGERYSWRYWAAMFLHKLQELEAQRDDASRRAAMVHP